MTRHNVWLFLRDFIAMVVLLSFVDAVVQFADIMRTAP